MPYLPPKSLDEAMEYIHGGAPERHLGPFRWRGRLNWKDITERSIAGFVSGLGVGSALGGTYWVLTRLVG